MKCNQCGTEFEGKFCPECGAKNEGETPVTPPLVQQQPVYQQQTPAATKPKKKKKTVFLKMVVYPSCNYRCRRDCTLCRWWR